MKKLKEDNSQLINNKLDEQLNMKKRSFKQQYLSWILAFVVVFPFTLAGQEKMKKEPLDTIVRLGGKKIPGNVLNVRRSTIYYIPENDTTNGKTEIGRKQVQKIIYKSGRVEDFNDPILTMVEEGDWQAVWVTEDPKQVEHLYERGKIEAESSASARNIKAAKKNARIRIQKKAANMGGTIVLLTNTKAKGGFGDFPSYIMEGTVYSFTAPKPGEPGYEE